MELTNTRVFPFEPAAAWEALHKASSLDVEPGAKVTVISDTEWTAKTVDAAGKELSVTTYTASFDDEKKIVTIEGVSNKKHDHDFIYLTLTREDDTHVSLKIDVEINLGVHLLARALAPFVMKHAQKIITEQIFGNFEALCTGKETKAMSSEELDAWAKKTAEAHFANK